MKSIIILTGSEKRHVFFRKYLGTVDNIKVLKTFSESQKGNIQSIVNKSDENTLRVEHLKLRDQFEKDYFSLFNSKVIDNSNNLVIEKGTINEDKHVSEIIDLNPDFIISYGCSIIKSDLISVFKGRFINIHLGLSPYYRGAGTNYFPFVNNELQFVGATYMFIDKGVDTGEIIHQFRADMNKSDSIHTIGNRLIRDMTIVCSELVLNFEDFKKSKKNPLISPHFERVYKKRDFTEETLKTLYKNVLENNIVLEYLKNKNLIDEKYPIINMRNYNK